MTTTTAAPANDTRLADTLKRIQALGTTTGKAANALPELAQEIVYLTHERLIDISQTGDKCPVKRIWLDHFAKKRDAAVCDRNTDRNTLVSEKQQVSKLRAFSLAAERLRAANHDFTPVLRAARGIVNTVDDAVGSTYERLCTVARKQKDQATPMTDDEIRAALTPEASQAKTELDKLNRFIKDMTSMGKGSDKNEAMPSRELSEAIGWLQQRAATIAAEEAQAKVVALRTANAPASTLVPAAQ